MESLVKILCEIVKLSDDNDGNVVVVVVVVSQPGKVVHGFL